MAKNDDYLSDGGIEPVWLETPLRTDAADPAPVVAPARRSRWIWVILLCVTAAVAVFVWRVDQPDASHWMQTGWQAYRAGHYATAQDALEKARSAQADLEGLERLSKAVAVGPQLDEAEALLSAGDLGKAQALLDAALERAPEDPRALQAALALKTAIPSADRAPPVRPTSSARPASVASAPAALDEGPPSAVVSAAVVSAAVVSAATSTSPETPDDGAAAPDTVAEAPPRSKRRLRARRGRVRVVSNRTAVVAVDNVLSAERTPTTLRLKAGQRQVQLHDPDSGRMLASQTVRVRAGQWQTLRFTVARPTPDVAAAVPRSAASTAPPPVASASESPASEPPGAPVRPTAALATAAPTAAAPATAAPATAAPATTPAAPIARATGPTGFLSVTSSRPAQVIINGRATGLTTPLWMHKVPSGRHRVALRDATGTFGSRVVVIKPKQMVPIVIRKGTKQ